MEGSAQSGLPLAGHACTHACGSVCAAHALRKPLTEQHKLLIQLSEMRPRTLSMPPLRAQNKQNELQSQQTRMSCTCNSGVHAIVVVNMQYCCSKLSYISNHAVTLIL